jgi:glycosyltransferase involved in cell wall biosynthesis
LTTKEQPDIKVCIVNASPHVFGAEKSMAFLARSLAEGHIQFSLVSPGGACRELFNSMGVEECYELPLSRFVKTCNPAKLFQQACRLVTLNIRLYLTLRQRKPEIIHANGIQGLLYCLFASRLLRLPLVWHVRDLEQSSWLSGICATLAHVLIVPSQAASRQFAKQKAKVHLVPNLLNTKDAKGDEPVAVSGSSDDDSAVTEAITLLTRHKDAFKIGLIGQLIPRKGHDLLLEAFPEILEHVPQAQLWFIGDDLFHPNSPYIERLQHIVQATPIMHNRVFFLGYLERVETIFPMLELVAIPSRQEAFGRVALEAMSYGCPTVASCTGGLAELIKDGDNGLLFEIDDAAALAKSIIKLTSDSFLRHSIIAEGRKTALAHQDAIPQVIHRISTIYHSFR